MTIDSITAASISFTFRSFPGINGNLLLIILIGTAHTKEYSPVESEHVAKGRISSAYSRNLEIIESALLEQQAGKYAALSN